MYWLSTTTATFFPANGGTVITTSWKGVFFLCLYRVRLKLDDEFDRAVRRVGRHRVRRNLVLGEVGRIQALRHVHPVGANGRDAHAAGPHEIGQDVDRLLLLDAADLEIEAEAVVATAARRDVSARVEMGEVGQFEGVIADSVAALHPVLSSEDRQAVLRGAEEIALTLEVQEKQVPERGGLPGQPQVVRVPGRAVEDQVGEDSLLLLPEVLGGT